MKPKHAITAIIAIIGFTTSAKADFGEADFPSEIFSSGARSYHDAWCGKINNKCRVRFQGKGMWVEGEGGIQRSQLINFRYREDGDEHYNYIKYKSDNNGKRKEALFLFAHDDAQNNFMQALTSWYRLDSSPNPNYRYPASQGPQETHGRDKSFGRNNNPYDNEPITDWSETTQPW